MTLSLDTPSISSLSSVAGHQHPMEGAAHDRMREPKGYSGLPGPQPERGAAGGAYKFNPHNNLGSWAPFSPLRQEHRPSKTPSRADAMSQGFNSGHLCLAICTPSAAPQLPLLYLKMASCMGHVPGW